MKKSSTRRILYFLFSFLIIATIVSPPAFANYYIDSLGQIYYIETGAVLGKTDRQSSSDNRPDSEILPTPELVPTPSGPIKLDKKSQKIEVKTNRNQLKIQFVDLRNKPLTVSNDSTASSQITIEKPADADIVTLASTNSASQIIRNKITAQTHFPLMVNLETNELIVTTPKGEKIVTILPDQAVAHMLAANVLDQAGGKGGLLWLASLPTPTSITTPEATLTPTDATPTGEISLTPTEIPPTPTEFIALESTPAPEISPTPTLSPTDSSGEIVLTQQADGVLTYEIPGTKTKKLFGFYKITLNRTAVVSAETGELITVRQTPGDRILDLLSN